MKPKQAPTLLLEALVHQEDAELKQASLGGLLPCLCHQQHHRGRRPGPGCRHRCAPGGGPAASSWRPEGGAEAHVSWDAFDGKGQQLNTDSRNKNYALFWHELVQTKPRGRVQEEERSNGTTPPALNLASLDFIGKSKSLTAIRATPGPASA